MENRLTFGVDAEGYRRYRPRYPRELYDYLGVLAPNRTWALDCATGNGQAALDLAACFDRVAGFDSSETQIAAAYPHPRIEYAVADAESLPYPAGRFALIVAAQAAHWFDLDAFYREVRRVAVPGGIIALWGYSYCTVDPVIDAMAEEILLRPIESHWARGNEVILERYARIEFPFAELAWPGFVSAQDWTREDYMQYLRTWSAVRKYAERHGVDPVVQLDAALGKVWPDATPRPVRFEFVGRVGRVE